MADARDIMEKLQAQVITLKAQNKALLHDNQQQNEADARRWRAELNKALETIDNAEAEIARLKQAFALLEKFLILVSPL